MPGDEPVRSAMRLLAGVTWLLPGRRPSTVERPMRIWGRRPTVAAAGISYRALMRELCQDSPVVVGTALTAREVAVLRFIADGYSNAHIARSLSCSHHTVKNVIHGMMARLQLRNRAHAAAYAVRTGLI